MAGRLLIVCGLPGSGKTTLSRSLATTEHGVRLNPDEWMDALGVNLWDSEVRASIEALQWSLARELLSLDNTVIIEWGTWARVERDALREGARHLGAGVELHLLDVPIDELWRRVQERDMEDPPMERTALEAAAASFETPTADELSLFDGPCGSPPS